MLSPELERFVRDWLSNADDCSDTSVDGCYDKFFTLFVVFNRLYAEATFELARRGTINLPPNRPLPDRNGATTYTFQLIGATDFEDLYDNRLARNVGEIAALIDEERFFIKLSVPDGDRQRDKDLDLLARLRSSGETQALAVLDLIYSIRCNLFHGDKAFEPIQTELLRPAIAVLSGVIESLHKALNQRAGQQGHPLWVGPTALRP
jgi:hypothetical protein